MFYIKCLILAILLSVMVPVACAALATTVSIDRVVSLDSFERAIQLLVTKPSSFRDDL